MAVCSCRDSALYQPTVAEFVEFGAEVGGEVYAVCGGGEEFESGDRHVEFLDGETIFSGEIREDCTSDGCHQNDLGERVMAERIVDRLKRMIAEQPTSADGS